jgi:hypothetical protein
MDEAAERLLHDHRANQLRNQADSWDQADRIRRYCAAAEAAHGDRTDTASWLEWARAYAANLDPLTQPTTTPELSDVSIEEMQPYLPAGWSAQGPDQGLRHSPYQPW